MDATRGWRCGEPLFQPCRRVGGQVIATLANLGDKAGKTRDTLPLLLRIDAPPQPRVLALAGAPTPELKYLRRWAIDAGIPLHTRIGTGGGLTLGDAPLALDAASLRRFDAVLLDVRSLRALGGSELAALTAAVRDGLGLLLRIDEPLSPADRTRLRSWGYALDAGQSTEPAQLPGDAALPALSRRILRIDAADAATLLRDARDRPLASWRTLGRGRVAVLAFDDSFQLALGGYPSRHAGLWSDLVAAVARARDAAPLSPPTSSFPPGPAPPWVSCPRRGPTRPSKIVSCQRRSTTTSTR